MTKLPVGVIKLTSLSGSALTGSSYTFLNSFLWKSSLPLTCSSRPITVNLRPLNSVLIDFGS